MTTRSVVTLVLLLSACRGAPRSSGSPAGAHPPDSSAVPVAQLASGGASGPTAFAVVSGREATSLIAVYDGSAFRLDTNVLDRFRVGRQLIVGAGPGREHEIRVDSLFTEPEYYDPEFYVSPAVPSEWPDHALAWTPNRSIRLLAADTVPLPPDVERTLPAVIDSLFQAALLERQPDERPLAFTIRSPHALRVAEARDVLLLVVPIDLSGKGWVDKDRASAVVVYSTTERRVVYAVFGHPEWAPVDDSRLLTVIPHVFFQVAGDPHVYFMGDASGSWESTGHAIYDVRTGRSVLDSR